MAYCFGNRGGTTVKWHYFAMQSIRLTICGTVFFTAEAKAHGDLSERIGELKAAAEKSPGDGSLRLQLAEILYQNGNYGESLTALAALDRLAPGKFPTDKLRGLTLLALQRPAEAREALERFLNRFPGDPPALLYRARALAGAGLAKDAVAAYREALKSATAPEPDLFQEVAAALSASGGAEEALSVLERGLKVLGNIPSLAQRALEMEVSLKRFDAALARVESLRSISARPEPWMAKHAGILTAAGRIEDARKEWKQLIAHLDSLPDAVRGSNAMSRLAEEARQNLRTLGSLASLEARPP
ncbi:MAG TPA: tetratricopeptide repeat protein [Verrucomicrobiales bacterium]|jgi:tetratricopeptide (TPR) repeat protein|nr:tetratricopeptide repeat protein [Verrucomicrobiales bacterium]